MICTVITGPSLQEAEEQINEASTLSQILEFRLDCFERRDLSEIKELIKKVSLPFIFTLRPIKEGGFFKESEELRQKEILRLSTCNPNYFDLESFLPLSFIEQFQKENPHIKLIVSYHDFSKETKKSDSILSDVPLIEGSITKIALSLGHTTQALEFMLKLQNRKEKVLIAMGDSGSITRILAPYFGSLFTYACIDQNQKTAPGQLTVKELIDNYRYHSINTQTHIYGLIGNPVEASIGHFCHNAVFEATLRNAVYVKMPLTQEELALFFKITKEFNFKGFSVTMPHKETVIPLLDEVDSEALAIGAVNTVILKNGLWVGYNTDGKGALDAIAKYTELEGKKILLLGAGGAARAVIYEALKRGCLVTIANRTKSKALVLAKQYNCGAIGFDELSLVQDYDILINSTPEKEVIEKKYIRPNSIVMDMTTNPIETEFLKQAKERSCVTIPGVEMFIRQALRQQEIWFGDQLDSKAAFSILETTALEKLK